jgi:IS5 family transposase
MQIADEIRQRAANLETIFVIIYFFVDEEYKKLSHLVARPGPKPQFSDSEVITLSLLGEMFIDSADAWYGYVAKNHAHLFPKLISASRVHRRTKDLQLLVEMIRQKWAIALQVCNETDFVMDSMPLPVCKRARAGRNDRWAMEYNIDLADFFGHCASKKEDIFGFKLHLLVTKQGIPAHYVLAPASEHDVVVATNLLESYRSNIEVAADKGYVGLLKRLQNPEQHHIIIQARQNQKEQNTKEEKDFLFKYRKTVETTNSILTEQFHIQRTRALSKFGIQARIIFKITALTLAMLINFSYDCPILSVKSLIF